MRVVLVYILLIVVPLGYSSSFAKQASLLFLQASNWLVSQTTCSALSTHMNFVKISSSWLTLLGPQFVTRRWSFTWPKVSARPYDTGPYQTDQFRLSDHQQLHVWAWNSTTSIFSVIQPVWSNYQNCCYWLLWGLTSKRVTLSPKVLNAEVTKFSHNVLLSVPFHWLTPRRHQSTITLNGQTFHDHQGSRYMSISLVFQWWMDVQSHINCPLTQCSHAVPAIKELLTLYGLTIPAVRPMLV